MCELKYGVNVVEWVTKVCRLLVVVFVCYSCRIDAAPIYPSDALSFRPSGTLTYEQLKSVVTIEFSFKDIHLKNKTAVDIARREVCRILLEYLNRWRSTATAPNTTTASTTLPPSSPTPASTAITTTNTTPTTAVITTTLATTAAAPTTIQTTSVVETTTETPTTAATSTLTTQQDSTTLSTSTKTVIKTPRIERRKRSIGDSNVTFTEEDLQFILNDPAIDGNRILRISIFLDTEGLDDLDDLLYNASRYLNDTGDLKKAAGAPVENIYKGLPLTVGTIPTVETTLTVGTTQTVETANLADYRVWLPILLAILLLLIIFIFVFCWKATNKKVQNEESKKIVPKLESKPDSSNVHVPRILDESGWIVPYEQFSNERQ